MRVADRLERSSFADSRHRSRLGDRPCSSTHCFPAGQVPAGVERTPLCPRPEPARPSVEVHQPREPPTWRRHRDVPSGRSRSGGLVVGAVGGASVDDCNGGGPSSAVIAEPSVTMSATEYKRLGSQGGEGSFVTFRCRTSALGVRNPSARRRPSALSPLAHPWSTSRSQLTAGGGLPLVVHVIRGRSRWLCLGRQGANPMRSSFGTAACMPTLNDRRFERPTWFEPSSTSSSP